MSRRGKYAISTVLRIKERKERARERKEIK